MVSEAKELKDIVGEKYLSENIYERYSYARDPTPYDVDSECIPDLVVMPKNTGEVSKVVEWANRNKTPVMMHGSGTSLIGNARPKRKGIILSTKRLDDISIKEDYINFECGAGARVATVESEVKRRGYFLPLAPGSKRIATMGGIIAANTLGHMLDSAYGKPINNVIGLEVVLADGSIIETGTDSLRRPAGIDLTRFFVGSEGLFGVITKVKMELRPDPSKRYLVGIFENDRDITEAWKDVYRHKETSLPLFGEYLDKEAAQKGFERQGLEPPVGPVTLVTAIGDSEESAETNAKRIVDVFRENNAHKAFLAENEEKRKRMWAARNYVGSLYKGSGATTGVDVVSALPHLSEAIEAVKKIPNMVSVFSNLEYVVFGHVGSLDFHGTFLIPKDMSDEEIKKGAKEVWQAEKELNLKFEAAGGEWGQMSQRVPFFKEKYGEDAYDLLKRVKNVFDPNDIFNRGNIEGGP